MSVVVVMMSSACIKKNFQPAESSKQSFREREGEIDFDRLKIDLCL